MMLSTSSSVLLNLAQRQLRAVHARRLGVRRELLERRQVLLDPSQVRRQSLAPKLLKHVEDHPLQRVDGHKRLVEFAVGMAQDQRQCVAQSTHDDRRFVCCQGEKR